jgi:glycosyltransferase involved in cell wall biosynthesis
MVQFLALMKVAIFTDTFLPGTGGTENAIVGLGTALAKEHTVLVCAPSYHRKFDDSVFPFAVVRSKSLRLLKNDNLSMPATDKKFVQAVRNFAPDIIHCQTVSSMTWYAQKYGRSNRVPVIMTIHTKFRSAFQQDIKLKFVVNRLMKNMVNKLNSADAVFAVSQDVIETLHNEGFTGNAIIIKNGTDFRVTDIEKLDNNKINFLFVGRITKYKNIQFILDAIKKLAEKTSNFHMFFVGGGADLKHFILRAKDMGLTEFVTFTGEIKDKHILAGYYSAADLFLFPSTFDNDPLVVVEAACAATPSITLENTGACERITPDIDGFVVPNNIDAFANKVYELMQDKKLLADVGKNAQAKLPKSWDTVAEEYTAVYSKLIADFNGVGCH